MATPFVHLHNHSEFSFLDGASKIKEMAKIAVEMEMPAIALTDHGTMYGSFEFYEACKAVGVQPIVGCELYVATRGRRDRDPKRDCRIGKERNRVPEPHEACNKGKS